MDTQSNLDHFLIWMIPGFLLAFAIASLPSIGLYVLIVGVVVLLLTIGFTKGEGVAGVLVGAGIVGLLVASMNADGTSFNPIPFLVAGLAAVLLGIGIRLKTSRRS